MITKERMEQLLVGTWLHLIGGIHESHYAPGEFYVHLKGSAFGEDVQTLFYDGTEESFNEGLEELLNMVAPMKISSILARLKEA